MKRIALILGIISLILCSSCKRTCHCYGRDGSHTYFTEEELAEKDVTCIGMETAFYGLKYSLCEWEF